MFVISGQSGLLSAEKINSLVTVLQSVNQEEVSFGNRVQGRAKAYIYTYEDVPESYSVEVFFHVDDQDKKFRLRHEKGTVQRFRVKTIEEKALEFVESMGFMMDNLQIHNLPGQQKNEMLRALPIFENAQTIKEQKVSISKDDLSSLEYDLVDSNEMKRYAAKLLSSL
ncbi:MAG: hypothetical protein KDD48_08135 [Bdellovibrionales bacterium]|nr:hypothetical protein [Bdellovibrionales bacterium]